MDHNDTSEVEAPLLGDGASENVETAADNQQCVIIHEGDGHGTKGALGSTHWLLTTCILLGDMFGLGTLSLPADFARLGWVPALVLLIAFSFGDVYSGFLYTRLCTHLPSAIMFDHIGEAAMGRVGKLLVYGTVYLTILGEPVIFHLTSVESLMQVFYRTNISRWFASLLVTVMILPMSQVQHMHEVGWIAILGTIGMLTATLIVVVKLIVAIIQDPTPAATQMVADSTVSSKLVGVMDIAFAFGGQVNWMRYITTMRKRSRFFHAVSVTTSAMTVIYLVVGIVGYCTRGDAIDLHRPITSVLTPDVWTIIMNFGLFLHCIIAYQINVNVWSHSFLHLLVPMELRDSSAAHPVGKYLLWGAITVLCVAFSCAVSFFFPFFSIVMAIIAALGDLASMFGLPALFSLKLLNLQRPERLFCWVLVVATAVLSAAGMFSSVSQLVAAFQESHKHPGAGNGLVGGDGAKGGNSTLMGVIEGAMMLIVGGK